MQLRQRVSHKRTFFYLEQLIMRIKTLRLPGSAAASRRSAVDISPARLMPQTCSAVAPPVVTWQQAALVSPRTR